MEEVIKMTDDTERAETATELLERIVRKEVLESRREELISSRRDMKRDAFKFIGGRLLDQCAEVYLTAHRPTGHTSTSYRLWIAKPSIKEHVGHPDWRNDQAVAEMCTNAPEESIVAEASEKSNPLFVARLKEVHYDKFASYCKYTRVYTLK